MDEAGVPGLVGSLRAWHADVNMASLTCPHCSLDIDLYGESKRLEEACAGVLGRLPFDTRLSVAADTGLPLVLGDPRGPIAYGFARIGGAVRRWLVERDTELSAAA